MDTQSEYEAIYNLGKRYTPELHVELPISEILDELLTKINYVFKYESEYFSVHETEIINNTSFQNRMVKSSSALR